MKIYIAIHDYEKNKPLIYIRNEKHAKELNEKGYGIFGTVNEFNRARKEEDIKSLTSFYVDFDEGDKLKQLQALKNFLMPSMVIESKNGYHAYWYIEDDLVGLYGKEQALVLYKEINKRLNYWLGGDEGVYDGARILRVPDFYHQKNPFDKFLIKKVFEKNVVYKPNEMLLWLRPIPTKEKSKINLDGASFESNEFWENAHHIDCREGLTRLSGHKKLKQEIFEVGHDDQIYVNGKRSQCWIDENGMIGSHSGGGPTIPNWINWYFDDWSETAKIISEVFPEVNKTENFLIWS